VHDGLWTTDREIGARRWSEIEPRLRLRLARLESWIDGTNGPTQPAVDRVLAVSGLIPRIVENFRNLIGIWLGSTE
jgi:hypothetical protein